MGIGSKLRERRQELNLSRSQLAEKIHVTPLQLLIMKMGSAIRNLIFLYP